MFKELINTINNIDGDVVIISIDGRCASGKSSLASYLKDNIDCNVFHMDDYFLQAYQRNKESFNSAGENVDHERFLKEVLIPLKNKQDVKYKPFDCKDMIITKGYVKKFKRINIIEGAYCNYVNLIDYYDYKVFLNVDKVTQMERITKRNGDTKAKEFIEKWIPLEEKYFEEFSIDNICDLVIKIEDFK